MILEFKIATWKKIAIPKELEDIVINQLKEEGSFSKLSDYIDIQEIVVKSIHELVDPEQNNNESTIILYNNDDSIIYTN